MRSSIVKIVHKLMYLSIIMAFNYINAQKDSNELKISTNTLQGSTWQIIGPDNSTPFVIEFTGDKFIHYYDGAQVGVYDYYLSNNSEKGKKFNKKKIGKRTEGKHLIGLLESWNKGDSITDDYIITKLNKNLLVIKNVDRDITTKFK
ncbi:MAG: hypothetical protein ACK5M7_16270 [Draconibacterium sp.]